MEAEVSGTVRPEKKKYNRLGMNNGSQIISQHVECGAPYGVLTGILPGPSAFSVISCLVLSSALSELTSDAGFDQQSTC